MTTPDLSQLFLNPREFLRHNLLIMDTSPVGVCGSTTQVTGTFKIAPDRRFDGSSRRSKRFWKESYDISVNTVSWKTGGGHGTVPGVWLPYKANDTCTAVLPRDVPFMFTAPFSGCTFAHSTFSNGTARVAHSNYQVDGRIDSGRIKANTSAFGKTFNRGDYRSKARGKRVAPEREAGLLMTVIGANDAKKGWRFFGQQYEVDLVAGTVEYIQLHYLN